MHRSPTDITAGVSATTTALKRPSLELGHATQTEPRAREEPPAVFRAIEYSNLLIMPIAPAARMNLSAMRLRPQPAPTMSPSVPRCTGDFPPRAAAAEPPWAAPSFSSDASQRCRTSRAKSDALTCAPLNGASHAVCIRRYSSLGNFHLSPALEGSS
eukprot:5112385-Pyramimonas_sp.AAC.2